MELIARALSGSVSVLLRHVQCDCGRIRRQGQGSDDENINNVGVGFVEDEERKGASAGTHLNGLRCVH